MLSVPVMTDENELWDLQEALETVENQFCSQTSLVDDPDTLSPQ